MSKRRAGTPRVQLAGAQVLDGVLVPARRHVLSLASSGAWSTIWSNPADNPAARAAQNGSNGGCLLCGKEAAPFLSVRVAGLQAGLVEIEKKFEGKQPITYAKLTREGREALKDYWKRFDKVRAGVRSLKPLRTT